MKSAKKCLRRSAVSVRKNKKNCKDIVFDLLREKTRINLLL
jgi:hypothetical protein